jgi:hypothetical protein
MDRQGIITLALRRIGVLASDVQASADEIDYAGGILDLLVVELATEFTFSWDLTAVPSEAAIPLANLLAVEIGPHYQVPTESRGRAYGRLMAVLRPDDRTDVAEPVYF